MNIISTKNLKIFHEDALVAIKKLPDNSVDLIATDPPYFLDGMGNDWSDKKLKDKTLKSKTIGSLPVGMKFDPKQGLLLQSFFRKLSEEAIRVLKPGGFMIAFAQGRLFHRMAVAAEDSGFEIRDMFIWEHGGGQGKAFKQDHFVKKMKISQSEKDFIISSLQERKTPQLRPKFEPILLAQKPKEGTFVENWMKWKTGLIETAGDFEKQQSTIFFYKKPKKDKSKEHLTVKPVDLMERLIEIFTTQNQIVLDPFLGTGTTAIASLNKKRKFIGFEIEKKYIEIAISRIKKL